MDFTQRLQVYEFSLSETDDMIGAYISAHRTDAAQMSIQKLAGQLHLAPNALLRFAKKLGYSGFAEMKLALRQEGAPPPDAGVPQNIRRTLEMLAPGSLQLAAKAMFRARRVYFYGIGDSEPLCEMMTHNLKCVGRTAECFSYRHDMYYSAQNARPGDLVLVISATGETDMLIQALQMAKERGAASISLTHLCKNPVAALADYNLYCWVPTQLIGGYEVTDRTPLMLALRFLSEAFWQQCGVAPADNGN